MPTAKPANEGMGSVPAVTGGKTTAPAISEATQNLPATFSVVLGKALAVGILLTPLVLMLFSELNHRSGNTASGGIQGAKTARTVAGGDSSRRHSDLKLVPFDPKRSDR